MYDTLISSQYNLKTKDTDDDRSWVKDLDLSRYMGWGKKMFPDIDAQDYIKELRDCDRTF